MPRWLAILAVFVSTTCKVDGPGTTPSTGDPPGIGRITILLTDQPLEDVDEVHVWITGMSTEPRGGSVLDFDKELGDVELLSLRNRTIEVVNTEVPTGTYDYVAFRIDESRCHIVESGVTKPLAVPDGNVLVPGPFEV